MRNQPLTPAIPPTPLLQRSSSSANGLWTFSLVMGIVSLVIQFWLCGCGSILALPLSTVGLTAAVLSRGYSRTWPLVLNGLAFLFSGFSVATGLLWLFTR